MLSDNSSLDHFLHRLQGQEAVIGTSSACDAEPVGPPDRHLEALLTVEVEERERYTIERRIKEAHLPRVKTREEFDYMQTPMVTAAKMRELAEGGYIERAEPVVLTGDSDPATFCISLLRY